MARQDFDVYVLVVRHPPTRPANVLPSQITIWINVDKVRLQEVPMEQINWTPSLEYNDVRGHRRAALTAEHGYSNRCSSLSARFVTRYPSRNRFLARRRSPASRGCMRVFLLSTANSWSRLKSPLPYINSAVHAHGMLMPCFKPSTDIR